MAHGGLRRGAWSRSGRRRAAWLVFVAYLPSLLFFGHWELQIDIPGTHYYVGLPELGHSHSHAADEHDTHAQHCHTNLSSCSDLPLVTTAPVSVLAAIVESPPAEGRALPAPSAGWQPHDAESNSPEDPPPRVI